MPGDLDVLDPSTSPTTYLTEVVCVGVGESTVALLKVAVMWQAGSGLHGQCSSPLTNHEALLGG